MTMRQSAGKQQKVVIYRVTNKINGKLYVGQTCRTLVYRKNIHKQAWKLGRGKDYRLYKAFSKYGWENFDWDVLEVVTSTTLNARERFWIKSLNSFGRGYNMTEGGDYNPNIGKFGKLHHNSRSYLITHPNGLIEKVTGIREFCRKHGLHHQGLLNVANKTVKHYKGFVCSRSVEPSTTSLRA